ncbi:MAG: inverse autotransporter beta domain-containing protein, partial [Desulfomonilaceae bacterium]
DMAPSNPLRAPGTSGPWSSGGSDSVLLSSCMFQGLLPPIPNLQLGYLYSFSGSYGAGRLSGDYLKPFSLDKESFIFGEAHVEGWNFWNSGSLNGWSGGRVNNRVDVSLGGGYRKFFGNQALVGINGFYDTTRLTGQWFSSGGLGLQAAWLLPGSDALDLNFNWYGQLFNSYEWTNTFRYGPSNYDLEAGYSHEIWNGGPDLRLKIRGYHFYIGSNLNGWTGGAELKSRDGMLVLKYEVGYDRLDYTYQTIGGYVNVGFQLENLLKGESPFTAPTPIFRSPRNLSYMASQPVKRNWNQQMPVARGGDRGLILDNIVYIPSFHSNPAAPPIFSRTGANSFSLTWVPTVSGSNGGMIYYFHMSDNSIQTVRGTITPPSLAPTTNPSTINAWGNAAFPSYGQSVTGLMNGVLANSGATFNQGTGTVYHGIFADGGFDNFNGQVVFDVPGDPSITPLVISFQVLGP